MLVTGIALLTIGKLMALDIDRMHYLLPQVGSVLLLYLAYLAMNLGIIRLGVMGATKKPRRWLRIGLAFSGIFVLSYILGPVVNFIPYYVSPEYKGFEGIPLTFGFHPQPLLNLFGGWDMSFILVTLYGLYAVVREIFTWYFEKPRYNRSYRVLVINKVTGFTMIVLGLPFLFAFFRLANPGFYRYYFALVPPTYLFVLCNFYWLFPIQAGKGWKDYRFFLRLAAVAAGLTILFSRSLGEEWTPGLLFFWIIFQLVLVAPATWFAYNSRKDVLLELRGSQTALARSNADIQALRSQINPHFLFNALNSLYAMALRDGSTGTASGIQQLGDMMRFMLEDNQQELIPMSSELGYLRNYIAFQRLRIPESDQLSIRVDIDDQECDSYIAPMLLIPFVENAFKHGIRLERKSWITIHLKCIAGELVFRIANSLHPVLANDTERGRSGIGLQNVRDRLLLLYPHRHELEYGAEAGEFVITLRIRNTSELC